MLLPYTTLTYYGAGAGAIVDTQPSLNQSLDIKADKRLAASIQGGQIDSYLKMTRALIQYLEVTGLGELHLATWKKNARIALDVSIGASPSAFDIAQAVWLQSIAAVNVPNTTGSKLNSAGSSADPWSTTLPGAYAPGEAGYIIGNDITTPPTAEEVSQAVWNELKTGHITANTYGKIVQDLETLSKQIKALTAAQL